MAINMDEFKVPMEKQKTTIPNKVEQQSIQTRGDYYNPHAVAEWEEFVSEFENPIRDSTISFPCSRNPY